MKLLKIDSKLGHFSIDGKNYLPIDKITKEHLLQLVNLTLTAKDVEFDPYVSDNLPNQAHQVIYKSVCAKLTGLYDRRAEFNDDSARLFLEDYEKYKKELSKADMSLV